jgi:release factor glutamine methyltransferase
MPSPEVRWMLASAAIDEIPVEPVALLRPSEYTAMLVHVLRRRAAWVGGAEVLEVGSGSGVVLAALGELGAATLCGVDIEPEAIQSGRDLLRLVGHGDRAEFIRGDMWQPLGGRRFGLIVANLPHFPMVRADFGSRLPSWSFGGPDGRLLLDRFLKGLPTHLAPGGRAVITHNAFVNLALSQAIVEDAGLSLRVAATVMVYLPPEKIELMTRAVLAIEEGRSIHRHGPYAFGELHIVEIGTAEAFR